MKNNNTVTASSDMIQDKKFKNIFTLQQILNDSTPLPDSIIGNGILSVQSLLLISGIKKSYKSMLAMNLALAISNGMSFSIFEIKNKHKVLLISAEGGYYGNRERIQKMSKKYSNNSITHLNMSFDSRILIDSESGQSYLSELLSHYNPEVLIIDPLIKFHNSDENSSKEMIIVMTELRNLIEDFKISIILVHHMGKNPNSGPRGSSVVMGEYDSCIEMTRNQTKKNQVKLTFDLRHFESPDPKYIVFNPNTFWFENNLEKLSSAARLVYELGPISREELVSKLVESKKYSSDSNAQKAIKKDLDNGKLEMGKDKLIRLAK